MESQNDLLELLTDLADPMAPPPGGRIESSMSFVDARV